MKSNNSWILLKSKVDTIPLDTIPSDSKGRSDPIYHIIFLQLLSGSAEVAQVPLASINHEAEVMGWGSILGWMSRISSGLGFLQSLFTLRIKGELSNAKAQFLKRQLSSPNAWPLSVWCGALWRRSEGWNSSAFISAVASFLASFPSVTTDSKWPANNNCN